MATVEIDRDFLDDLLAKAIERCGAARYNAECFKHLENRLRSAESHADERAAIIRVLEDENRKMKTEREDALPKLAELHESAGALYRATINHNVDSNLADRVRNALEAARPYCDEIPF